METAVFKSYRKGYYTFEFDNGEDMVFEEVHPKVLSQYKLKEDESLIGMEFKLTFSEVYTDDDDLVIYRIESLKLI
ncbi:MAG: hypothetical protein R2802_06305 [Flavobacteriaceae bacterium]|nr:hypothetical protein [Mangrovimonas sp.]MCB0469430.1 hypothetical protein [Flavobacteriaceae bacterium]MCB0428051.1 hypothetical protein [Mangrovimonas sp.]MCB0433126.1 hypothetical protein [Mangrovimonas sp.]MCB0435769.1 hypothetical protein [Mangrovimonas sp.]